MLVALDFAVDLGAPVGDQDVADRVLVQQFGERPVAGVGPGVVAHQLLHLDSFGGEGGKAALDKARDGRRLLVRVELAVDPASVVVEEGVDKFVSDPHPFLGSAAMPITGDRVTGPCETGEAFRVHVQQIAGTRPLVAAARLARLARLTGDPGPFERPPDGRVRVTGLTCDQPRPPARPPPGRTDPRLLIGRQKPRAVVRPRGTILKTHKQPTLLGRRFQPASPPLTRGRRRDAAASRRLPARAA